MTPSIARALLALLISFSPHAVAAQEERPLVLEPDAHVVLLGGGPGSRMLHFGHFETGLHLRYPERRLVVRNMCDEGNTPELPPALRSREPARLFGCRVLRGSVLRTANRARTAIGHFATEEEVADARLEPGRALICFFGFTESFQGLVRARELPFAELDAVSHAHARARRTAADERAACRARGPDGIRGSLGRR